MNFLQVLILSVVQGLTEFLPVSSSGHLVIFQKLFGLGKPPILFDILLHIGTLGAVFFYFRKELVQIFFGLLKRDKNSSNIFYLVAIGTLPAALIGGLFEEKIILAFDSFFIVGLAFIFTALLLFSTHFIQVGNKQFSGEVGSRFAGNQLKWLDSLFIGLFQALAILPGVSRSGSTIVSGLWRGLSPETAFAFSFYLAIPAILGALALNSRELLVSSPNNLIQGLIGMFVAGMVGYFALRILDKILKSSKLWYFGIYCVLLGIMILLL